MQTSSIIFNAAAVVALVGVFLALADLMKHKTVAYGVTLAPTVSAVTSAPTAVTSAPTA
jgi:hypothetical protein